MADPALTPAGELRAAATKLREMAAAADTSGPWKANPLFRPLPGCRCLSCEEDKPWAWEIDVVDGPDNEDCFHPMHIGQGDAEWIALMGPDAAPAIASMLEHYAECVAWSDNWDDVHNCGKPVKQFARSILGGTA